MPYQAFPIYDLKSGLRLEKEPWLTPADGFRTLSNLFIRRGVLEKRRGLGTFGRTVHREETILTGGASGTITTTLPIVPGSLTIVHGAETYTDDGAGVLTGSVSHTGTINYTTGAWTTTEVLTNAQADFSWYPGLAVMGLHRHRSTTAESLLAATTKRINKYNTSTSVFDDLGTKKLHFTSGSTGLAAGATITGSISGATAVIRSSGVEVTGGTLAGDDAFGVIHIQDQVGTFQAENLLIGAVDKATISANSSYFEMTGDDTNFVWFETWNGITYATNNKDPLLRYNGTYYRQLNIDLDVEGGPDNDVNSALMVILYKSRLILLSITERGVSCRQRARYSNVNSDQIWTDDDYVDCPTSDWITGARFVGDQLVVTFSRSTWRLVYTGDSDLPFRWERISEEYGGVNPFSMASFDRRCEFLGETEMSACQDALEVSRIDLNIPDFVLDTNVDKIAYAYMAKIEELKQTWLLHVSSDSSDSKADKVLIRNYDEGHYAVADFAGLGIHCFGFFRWETTPTWDGLPAALGLPLTATSDDINVPFAFRQAQAGFPIFLMGNRTGYVYQYSVTYDDLGTAFLVQAVSGKWNPFIYKNRSKATLGFIDFMVDNVADSTITVNIYIDDEIDPIYTLTVDCESTLASDLIKTVRVYLGDYGATANFFRIDLRTEDSYSLRIHAVIPYFKPAGRADFVG